MTWKACYNQQPDRRDSNAKKLFSIEIESLSLLTRIGEHRALAVAKILEKRQNRILYPSGGAPSLSGEGEGYGAGLGEDGLASGGGTGQDGLGAQDPNSLGQPILNGTPVFQHLLFNFLDTQVNQLGV